MKIKLAAAAWSIGWLASAASNPVDPHMGDWQGTLQMAGGPEQPVAVRWIPLGEGSYEIKIWREFDRRAPLLHHLRGSLREAELKAADAIPFEAERVVRAVEDGLVVPASLWTGRLQDGELRGQLAGRQQGRFTLAPVQRLSPTLGLKPPAGAVILFDGHGFDAWRPRDASAGNLKWKRVEEGAMEAGGGDIITRDKFRDHRLHLEFRTPYMPHAFGQARGNSGVYLQGRYEVQVLDSYGLEGEDNDCGGIYQISRPAVNMCAPPLQWQTYDITFRAARFDAQGRKTAAARITVVQNGVTIHDNLELPKVTGGAIDDQESRPEGLLLQDHGNPVRFRNIWIEKLD